MGDVLSHGTSYRKKRHREARYAFGRFTRTQLPRHRERPGRLAGALLCRPFPLILLGILAREAWAAWGTHQALQPDHQPSRCGLQAACPTAAPYCALVGEAEMTAAQAVLTARTAHESPEPTTEPTAPWWPWRGRTDAPASCLSRLSPWRSAP